MIDNEMILKETEIVASYSGKISTGRFENEAPFFSIKEVWSNIPLDSVRKRQKVLHNICYEKFLECEQRSIAESIKKQRADLRFYDYKGKQLPSVTSIISWDKDFYMSQEQLAQYAAKGTIIHKQVEIYLKTGKWLAPRDIPEIYPSLVILKNGSLNISLDGYNFRGFKKANPFDVIDTERIVYNDEALYAGRCDIKGELNGLVTLFDVKTGSINKTEAFKQLTAYAHCDGNEDVEQLCIIPLNNTTKQGYSKPIICDDVNKYWSLFLSDRKVFKNRFGL